MVGAGGGGCLCSGAKGKSEKGLPDTIGKEVHLDFKSNLELNYDSIT